MKKITIYIDGMKLKKTDLKTFSCGKWRNVYEDNNGNLFYREWNHISGTSKEFCIEN